LKTGNQISAFCLFTKLQYYEHTSPVKDWIDEQADPGCHLRTRQRKMIKYHHLAANLLIFHNVVTMTKALKLLVADGHEIDEAALACFSPYQTEHLNKRDRVPEPLDRARVLRMPPRSEVLPAEKIKTSVTF
jgi:hypothetical protein